MKIALRNICKEYNGQDVIQDFSFDFHSGNSYAILGPNGSGKSTLLQIIAGAVTPTSGSVTHELEGRRIDTGSVYRHIALAAPYLDLPEDMNLAELLSFHARLKPLAGNRTPQQAIALLGFESQVRKKIRFFSSGMKQKVRLLLAILSETPLLLLDEPATNLDAAGVEWYRRMLADYSDKRLIFVCSNHRSEEHGDCTQSVTLDAKTLTA